MTIQIVQGQPAVRVPSEFFPFDSRSGARAGSMVQPSEKLIFVIFMTVSFSGSHG